jgi:hypothetical protein
MHVETELQDRRGLMGAAPATCSVDPELTGPEIGYHD